MRLRSVVSLLALLALALAGPATSATLPDSRGTDFWLMFPGNYVSLPTVLSLSITSGTNTSGTVTIPGVGFVAPFTVTANTVTTVIVPTSIEAQVSNQVDSLGIHVTSLDEVTVYGLTRQQYTTDAYLGLPTDILGTDYVVLGYSGLGSQLGIVGTVDNTTVTITPSLSTSGHVAGVPYTVALNQGLTYLLRGANNTDDVSGTLISSDKPIAVFGGTQCANIPPGYGACDNVVEELPTTSEWGKNFLSVPLATRTGGDTFRFLAQADNTLLTINGVPVTTLARGHFYEQILTTASVIEASEPILVAQYSNGSQYDGVTSDPFMMLVPPREQYQDKYTVTTPASGFQLNFINVIAANQATGAIILDGAPVDSSQFEPIDGTGFSGAKLPVALGSHHLESTVAIPFAVFVYGFDSYDSYGYPGGLSLAPIAQANSLHLEPRNSAQPVGTTRCFTATVLDQNNLPLNGIGVSFNTAGANYVPGFATTDSTGNATFCYAGANAGYDSVFASSGSLNDMVVTQWTAGAGDTTPPVITCPANIAAACGGPGGTTVNFTVTATDNVDSNVTVVSVPPSGSQFPVGTTHVVSTATDAAGNRSSCSFDVTVSGSNCPLSADYWRRHRSQWPVDSLTLGTTTYGPDELASFLRGECGRRRRVRDGEKSLALAMELIAAKFNVLRCANAPGVDSLIAYADSLIGNRTFPFTRNCDGHKDRRDLTGPGNVPSGFGLVTASSDADSSGDDPADFGGNNGNHKGDKGDKGGKDCDERFRCLDRIEDALERFNHGKLTPGCKDKHGRHFDDGDPDLMMSSSPSTEGLGSLSFSVLTRPNPFRGNTTIVYTLPKETDVQLAVYDLQGRELRTFSMGHMAAGEHQVPWDGTDASGQQLRGGVYFYRLIAGTYRSEKKIIISR